MKKALRPLEAEQPPAPIPSVEQTRFEAMGTEIVLLGLDVRDDALDRSRSIFDEAEKRFSRFLPDSELSQLNSRSSDRTRVSSELFAVLRTCRRMQAATGGVFDPGILASLAYLADGRRSVVPGRGGDKPPTPRSITEVKLEESKLLVTLPDGVRLDLGGIMRGWAMDRAAEALAPLKDFIIDAGGDIVAHGDGPAGGGWLVALAHPVTPAAEISRVILKDAAIATSSTIKRRWRRGDTWLHDMIDPRTGQPAQSDCLSASVIAPTAVEADVYAKSALILGSSAGRSLLKARGFVGLFVLEDGSVEVTEGWEGS